MANNDDDGRTFLDDFFDKAEEVVDGVERMVDGNKGVLPITFDDGSKIIADSIAGGKESTDGEPDWLVLRFFDRSGNNRERLYRRVADGDVKNARRRGEVIDIGGEKK